MIKYFWFLTQADKYNSKLNTKALHDSGCAKPIIHSKVFNNIPNVEQLTKHSKDQTWIWPWSTWNLLNQLFVVTGKGMGKGIERDMHMGARQKLILNEHYLNDQTIPLNYKFTCMLW